MIETVSANSIKGLFLLVNSTLFLKNLMSFTVSRLVFLCPVTDKYSQLRMPKKKAPVASCPIAVSVGQKLLARSFLNTDTGRAFSCLTEGSASTYPDICRVRNKDIFLSGSKAGSGRRFFRKAERTCVMEALTEVPLR